MALGYRVSAKPKTFLQIRELHIRLTYSPLWLPWHNSICSTPKTDLVAGIWCWSGKTQANTSRWPCSSFWAWNLVFLKTHSFCLPSLTHCIHLTSLYTSPQVLALLSLYPVSSVTHLWGEQRIETGITVSGRGPPKWTTFPWLKSRCSLALWAISFFQRPTMPELFKANVFVSVLVRGQHARRRARHLLSSPSLSDHPFLETVQEDRLNHWSIWTSCE